MFRHYIITRTHLNEQAETISIYEDDFSLVCLFDSFNLFVTCFHENIRDILLSSEHVCILIICCIYLNTENFFWKKKKPMSSFV